MYNGIWFIQSIPQPILDIVGLYFIEMIRILAQ